MVAAINLDEFADAVPAVTRLINLCRTLPARDPQPNVAHETAHCFLGQRNTVPFPQLLACQGRPEISVVVADQGQRLRGHARSKLAMPRLTTLARHQTGSAFEPIARHQPIDLPLRQAQSLCCH
jgi:hypothetical protein